MALMDALAEISEADFESIVAQIAAKDQELLKLKKLLAIVCVQLGKEDPFAKKTWSRQPKNPAAAKLAGESWADAAAEADRQDLAEELQPPAGTTKTEHYRSIIKRYIQANGPSPVHVLVKHTGIPEGSMGGTLKNPMFVKTALGYGLAANHR